MRIAELVIGGFVLLGLLLNLLNLPGGGAVLVVFLSTLSMFYLGFTFALFNPDILSKKKEKAKEANSNQLRLIGSMITGVGLSIASTGILFAVMLWPGSQLMLLVGSILLLVVACMSVFKYSSTSAKFYLNVLKRSIPVGLISLVLYLLPPYTLLEFKHCNHPSYVKAVKEYHANPENEELRIRLDEERAKMVMGK